MPHFVSSVLNDDDKRALQDDDPVVRVHDGAKRLGVLERTDDQSVGDSRRIDVLVAHADAIRYAERHRTRTVEDAGALP